MVLERSAAHRYPPGMPTRSIFPLLMATLGLSSTACTVTSSTYTIEVRGSQELVDLLDVDTQPTVTVFTVTGKSDTRGQIIGPAFALCTDGEATWVERANAIYVDDGTFGDRIDELSDKDPWTQLDPERDIAEQVFGRVEVMQNNWGPGHRAWAMVVAPNFSACGEESLVERLEQSMMGPNIARSKGRALQVQRSVGDVEPGAPTAEGVTVVHFADGLELIDLE